MQLPGEDTFREIEDNLNIAMLDGNRYYKHGNLSAARRARKALDNVAKLKVRWRKEVLHGEEV